MLSEHDADPVESPQRDTVAALSADDPTIVSISDIHGFIADARSALLTLSDHPAYDPIVESGRLHRLNWVGGDEYVLVFNGDLIDRGAHSAETIEMVERLIEQAPPGHVRVTLGNHEMGVLTRDYFEWGDWHSMTRTDDERLEFIQSILDGHVVAGYDGYNVTYAHAGLGTEYDVTELNDELIAGAETLAPAIGTADDLAAQEELIVEYPRVYGVGGRTGRGPDAGVAWLDFEHLPADAPPQVVGHTRQDMPNQKGSVICQNVIRNNRRSDGGEAVVVETPDELTVLSRSADGEVEEHEFSLPEEQTTS